MSSCTCSLGVEPSRLAAKGPLRGRTIVFFLVAEAVLTLSTTSRSAWHRPQSMNSIFPVSASDQVSASESVTVSCAFPGEDPPERKLVQWLEVARP